MKSINKPNAKLVIGLIRTYGALSRSEITEHLGVTTSTVTRLTNKMLEEGILLEKTDPKRSGKRGFPSKLLDFQKGSLLSAGVYIDPDHAFVGIADACGDIHSEGNFPVGGKSLDEILRNASSTLNSQMESLGKSPSDLIGGGITFPGQETHEPGRVLKTKQFAHWPTIDVRKDLAPYFEMPVFRMNDSTAACLAEMHYGSCRSYKNFCYIWLCYGIGGAAVINQNLYLGRFAGAAEFGGIFPKSSSRPSGQHLLDTLRGAGFSYDHLAAIPADMYQHDIVRKWIDIAFEQLRWLCLIISRTLAPDAIVLGGTLASTIVDEFTERLSELDSLGEDFEQPPPAIVRATKDGQPHLGAAALPLYRLINPEQKN